VRPARVATAHFWRAEEAFKGVFTSVIRFIWSGPTGVLVPFHTLVWSESVDELMTQTKMQSHDNIHIQHPQCFNITP